MKKLFGSIILGLLVLLLIVFFAISIVVNKKVEDQGEVDPSMLHFYHETYDENQDQFRELAASLQKQFSDVEISKFIVKSRIDSDLSIDTVYIPTKYEANKLLIMSSGVHGVEGFTGSAVQQYFMTKVLDGEVLNNMGVLLIHAINPYGFKYGRRVSENNVDMNRHFDVNRNLFASTNDGYEKISEFLNPGKKVRAYYFGNGLFFLKTAYYIRKYSMEVLRQSTLQGQYEFKNGIFFGGHTFEPQKEWLEQLILEKTNDYEYVFVIDIHTGYGKRGKIHFLPGAVKHTKEKVLLEKLFKGFQIDWPNSENEFINVRGGFRSYVGNLILSDKKYIGIVFEFGTLNSRTTIGSIRSLHNIILENQGSHHGYKNNKAEKIVKKRFQEMFFPSSEIWRSEVMKQASEILPILTDRYSRND